MKILAGRILKHRRIVLSVFLVVLVFCIFLQASVSVNYNLAEYLPEDAPSTRALNIMDEEFSQATPDTRVYVPQITLTEALEMKEKLGALEGVEAVQWLDDAIDLKEPIELADDETVNTYYKDSDALFMVAISEENSVQTIGKIRSLIGEDGAVSGQTVNMASAQETTKTEMTQIMIWVVPAVLIILFLATTSWFEPLLFLCAIGVSILINMGTNIFFGEVSFITQSVSPILQLAVSMDYAIFLLNSFARHRRETPDVNQAMRSAMMDSAPAVLASGLTTILGFLALVVMRFKIGPDLGFVLAKGIVLSLVSVMFFLPVLTLSCYRLIDKTQHRSFVPSFHKFGKFVGKSRIITIIIILILIVPCFLAQQRNSFTYGTSELSPDSRAGRDMRIVEEKFGKSTPMIVMIPKGDFGKELEVNERLKEIPEITSIVSYVNLVGTEIPEQFLPKDAIEMLRSENYSRFILTVDTPEEGEDAFSVVETVRSAVSEVYGDEYLMCGTSVNNYDMRESITSDNATVNLLAVIAIALVLLFTFKSLSIPLILLITIETSIWINLSIPYFTGAPICYIGYLVINTVQLGATVDYAILYTDHYIKNRKTLPVRDAIQQTVAETSKSILTSAIILTLAGTMIGMISSEAVVSELGTLLGRGAALSGAMVLFFLPAMLSLTDLIVKKTTWKSNFLKKERD